MLDVSSTAKERPGGGYVYIYHNPERPLAWQGGLDTYLYIGMALTNSSTQRLHLAK